MAIIPKSPTTDFTSTTLDGSINDSIQTIAVNDASTINVPTYAVIDREDNNGVATPNQREVIYISDKASNNLTVTRGVNGSTARAHNDSAKLEPLITVGFWDDLYDALAVSHKTTGEIVSSSTATLSTIDARSLSLASVATVRQMFISNILSASGASILGNFPITPVWYIPDNASAATVSLGRPVDMPQSGSIEFVSVTLRSPVSSASIIFDMNKNFVSIFEAGTRPFILGGGTFVSTASVNTKTFVAGDMFSVDLDAGGEYKDATVKFRAK